MKIAFADQTHQYIRDYIQSADQKAAFYFAAFTAVSAYSNSSGYLGAWLIEFSNWGLKEAISLLSSVLLLFAVFSCLWAVMPRLSGSKRGIIFFKAIAEFKSQNGFIAELTSKDPSQLLEEKLKHTFELAKVCSNKYLVLGIGLWSGGLGFVFLVLLVLFG